jgi:hypothetical protein
MRTKKWWGINKKMFGLTKKPSQNQEVEKNINLSQQKDFPVEDMPIHTMREDLESLQNPGAQHGMITPKNKPQQPNQNNLTPKQQSSPFLSEDEATWNKRHLLEEKDIKKPDLPKEINLDKATLSEKKELLLTPLEKKPAPTPLVSQKSAPLLPKNPPLEKHSLRLITFYLISFLLAIALIWASYFYLKNKNKQQIEPVVTEQTSQTPPVELPKETEPVKPTFSYSQTNPNYLRLEDASAIMEKINAVLAQTSQEGYTTPVEFVLTDAQNKPIGFKAFSSLANLKLSSSLLNLLGDNFSLFIYAEAVGPRIGLAIETKNSASLEKILLQEEKMLADGLNPIFFENTYDKTKLFESTDYSGVKIHYQNIISPDILSVDYAIYQNKLLFGTTRATMRAIIDRLNSTKEEVAPKIDPQLIPMPPIPEKAVDNSTN